MRRWQTWTLLAALGVGLVGPAVWADPPRWAPAHGYRKKKVVVVEPVPFVYSGVTYIPLRNVASVVGAALLWDSLDGRATLTYDGRHIGLVIGSPRIYYGDEVVVLPAAPLVVGEVVYVPADFCEHYLRVPVRHEHGIVVLEGPRGRHHEYRLASAPPGRVSWGKGGPPKREHGSILGRNEGERVRVRERDRERSVLGRNEGDRRRGGGEMRLERREGGDKGRPDHGGRERGQWGGGGKEKGERGGRGGGGGRGHGR